ncbi:MAG: hypothetical protein LBR29_05320 [Methylobacteriaceae bacterium]|nr:hypothetical protein [Methylobacteriaceae bacterium]
MKRLDLKPRSMNLLGVAFPGGNAVVYTVELDGKTLEFNCMYMNATVNGLRFMLFGDLNPYLLSLSKVNDRMAGVLQEITFDMLDGKPAPEMPVNLLTARPGRKVHPDAGNHIGRGPGNKVKYGRGFVPVWA